MTVALTVSRKHNFSLELIRVVIRNVRQKPSIFPQTVCKIVDLMFFASLKWSHGFLSMIFGFLTKFWVGIEKIITKNIFFGIKHFIEKNLGKFRDFLENPNISKYFTLCFEKNWMLFGWFFFDFQKKISKIKFWSRKNIFCSNFFYTNSKFCQESKNHT